MHANKVMQQKNMRERKRQTEITLNRERERDKIGQKIIK